MTQHFNYKIFSSSPAHEQAATQCRQNVGFDSLSPWQQEAIRREITNQVTQDIHNRVKELRQHIQAAIKSSGLDEKSDLARIGTFVRELDLSIQGGRQS